MPTIKEVYENYKWLNYNENKDKIDLDEAIDVLYLLWQAIKEEVERQAAHEKSWEADKDRFIVFGNYPDDETHHHELWLLATSGIKTLDELEGE